MTAQPARPRWSRSRLVLVVAAVSLCLSSLAPIRAGAIPVDTPEPTAPPAALNDPAEASPPVDLRFGARGTRPGAGAAYAGDLRDLASGRLEPGSIVLADDSQGSLAPGQASTVLVVDVDGDGRDELLQQRTEPDFALALLDGGTGTIRWSSALATEYYVALPVASPGGGTDVLMLFLTLNDFRFRASLLQGTTGVRLWERLLPVGDALGYFGVARDGARWDAVLGLWSGGGAQWQLALEYRSLADGSSVGTLTLGGTFNFPTAAIAGDLDADGVDDLFVLEPVSGVTLASGGTLRALTHRGAETLWSTTYVHAPADWTWIVAAQELTGDAVPDIALLTVWIGEVIAVPVSREVDTVAIIDGRGGDTAGLDPVASVALQQFVISLASPGDIDGDGAPDLVFSGGRLTEGVPSGEQSLLFEAVGARGRLWTTKLSLLAAAPRFFAGWWPDAGDLDGNGVRDAIALVGTADDGWVREVAIEQRSGGFSWDRTDLENGLVLALAADLSGDGRADVLDGFRVEHPRFQTRFEFRAARGNSLAPLWNHIRVIDEEGAFGVGLSAGRFGGGPEADVSLDYNLGIVSHLSECLDGGTGQVLWSDP